jgi:hypothetical protein
MADSVATTVAMPAVPGVWIGLPFPSLEMAALHQKDGLLAEGANGLLHHFVFASVPVCHDDGPPFKMTKMKSATVTSLVAVRGIAACLFARHPLPLSANRLFLLSR